VHPRPAPSKEQLRRAARQIDLLPCRLCGSPVELWQRWVRDDVWESFGACTNLEDVDGEACQFHLPDSPHFYRERRTDAAQYWNLIMGPRSSDETTAITPEFAAGFERGIVEKVIKDVEALAGERTDTYWAAHAQACEEIRHRLEEAWSALPAVEPSEQRRTYTAMDYVGIGPLPNCDACGRPYAEHDQIGYYCPPEKASACLHKSGCSEPLYKAGLCEAHYRKCVK